MKLDNLERNKNYLLACSYGPDSMALFYLLLKENYNFAVAHVNYGLRKEADAETEGLKKYCEDNNIPLYIIKADVDKSRNIESECRKIRYSFFKELCSQYHYDEVLVAHHQDDVLETYLMQKKRQICPKYFGIAAKTHIFDVDITRPLLNVSKEDLLKLCDDNNVPYAIDSSNLKDTYLRNRIRHHILAGYNDAQRENLISNMENDNLVLSDIYNFILTHDIHNIETLLNCDELTYLYCINESAKRAKNTAVISKEQAFEIRKILLSEKPNVSANIRGNLYFVKEYDACHFELIKKSYPEYCYVVDDRSVINNEHIYINLLTDTSNLHIKDEDFPITIRTARKNDLVTINDYQVEVRRLFIDWKMPTSIRKQWPVILNKEGKVIYIPRYQKDFQNDGKRNFYVKLK